MGRQITDSIHTDKLKQDGTYATGETYNSVIYEVTVLH